MDILLFTFITLYVIIILMGIKKTDLVKMSFTKSVAYLYYNI
jgi:hypothetical protein